MVDGSGSGGEVEVAYCPPRNYRDMRRFIYRLNFDGVARFERETI